MLISKALLAAIALSAPTALAKPVSFDWSEIEEAWAQGHSELDIHPGKTPQDMTPAWRVHHHDEDDNEDDHINHDHVDTDPIAHNLNTYHRTDKPSSLSSSYILSLLTPARPPRFRLATDERTMARARESLLVQQPQDPTGSYLSSESSFLRAGRKGVEQEMRRRRRLGRDGEAGAELDDGLLARAKGWIAGFGCGGAGNSNGWIAERKDREVGKGLAEGLKRRMFGWGAGEEVEEEVAGDVTVLKPRRGHKFDFH